VLNALVSSKQIRLKQTSATVCTDGRVPDKIRDRVPDCTLNHFEEEFSKTAKFTTTDKKQRETN